MTRSASIATALLALALTVAPGGSPAVADFSPVEWFEGADGFEHAIDEARRHAKPLLIYFRTDWCPYCREFERSLLASDAVQSYLDEVVRVTVNPEAGIEEAKIAAAYGVQSFPSIFLHPPGPAGARKIRRTTRQDGQLRLQTPEEFVQTLTRAARE